MLRYRADIPVVIAVSLIFAAHVAVWWWVSSIAALIGFFVLMIVPRGGLASYNHHHQHLNTFHRAAPNRLLEMMYGLLTGIISHGWVLHHSVGHHVNYLDQTRDESAWKTASGRKMGELEYTLRVGITAYYRAWKVGERYPKYRRTMVLWGVLTLALLGVGFALRPVQTLIVFAVPMLYQLFATVWATYTHHSGMPTDSHYVACNNIMHRGYNILTGNLGYHTAHHAKPGVHWSRLPELHASMAHLIPATCYLTPGIPFRVGQVNVPPPVGMPFAEQFQLPKAG